MHLKNIVRVIISLACVVSWYPVSEARAFGFSPGSLDIGYVTAETSFPVEVRISRRPSEAIEGFTLRIEDKNISALRVPTSPAQERFGTQDSITTTLMFDARGLLPGDYRTYLVATAVGRAEGGQTSGNVSTAQLRVPVRFSVTTSLFVAFGTTLYVVDTPSPTTTCLSTLLEHTGTRTTELTGFTLKQDATEVSAVFDVPLTLSPKARRRIAICARHQTMDLRPTAATEGFWQTSQERIAFNGEISFKNTLAVRSEDSANVSKYDILTSSHAVYLALGGIFLGAVLMLKTFLRDRRIL